MSSSVDSAPLKNLTHGPRERLTAIARLRVAVLFSSLLGIGGCAHGWLTDQIEEGASVNDIKAGLKERGYEAADCNPSDQKIVDLLNSRDGQGRTTLMLALLHGNTDLVDYMLQCDAYPSLTDDEGWNALRYAFRSHKNALVNKLLSSKRVAAIVRSKTGKSLFREAIEESGGDQELLTRLLQEPGVEANEHNKVNGDTYVMEAIRRGDTQLALFFIHFRDADGQSVFDLNASNEMRETALMLAVDIGNVPVAEALLATDGVLIDAKDIRGRTALMRLAADGQDCDALRAIAILLFDAGASTTEEDRNHENADQLLEGNENCPPHKLILPSFLLQPPATPIPVSVPATVPAQSAPVQP